jgi:protein-tyrosine phosphatase
MLIQCSAGQDRTGIAVGLILSALGTPRPVIYRDYLLSSADRTPANETADVSLKKYAATNSAARFLIAYRKDEERARKAGESAPPMPAQPLTDTKGRPLLQDAFERIETDYGSVDNYLDRALGVNARDIRKLRLRYLE